LSGKVVGILSKGSCGYWYARQILLQHGLDPDRDVTFRELGADYGRQLELFARGEVDAMLSNEPSCAEGEVRGVVRFWGSVHDLGKVANIQWLVEAANLDFIRQKPDLIAATLTAIRRCSSYAMEHTDEWAEFWSSTLGIGRETAHRAIARERPFRYPSGVLDLPGLQQAIALQQQLGAIQPGLGIADFVATQFQPERAVA
jgi:ABC-type nitrate/sulfonate/bicarbonate transport system substrate-binding protein